MPQTSSLYWVILMALFLTNMIFLINSIYVLKTGMRLEDANNMMPLHTHEASWLW